MIHSASYTDPGAPLGSRLSVRRALVTGVVAENLKRRWTCCELSEEYLLGARARFEPTLQPLPKDRGIPYEIASPCARPVAEQDVPLFKDGGAQRPASMRKKASPKIAAE